MLGIVNHLTHLEWRWIDGAMRGEETSRDQRRSSIPAPELTVESGARVSRTRGGHRRVRPGHVAGPPCSEGGRTDLRWVVLHLINETARHAGHADSTRELLDGVVGE